jgi:hypothetical protein
VGFFIFSLRSERLTVVPMSELRVALLIADPKRAADACAIRDILARVAPYCGVQTHVLESVHQLSEESPRFARSVAAALWSEIVLFLASGRNMRTSATLIALRERSGFTERFHEPEFARVWLTPNGRRSLYVLGALPGAYGALATALEYGCSDPAGAQALRQLARDGEERVVA